jgi:4-oxalocrotonate tautomerase
MPFVQIKLIEGVFSQDQKRDMLNKVSEAVLAVEGENMRQVTHVVIEEVKSGEWAIGGKPYSAEEVKALRDGKKAA